MVDSVGAREERSHMKGREAESDNNGACAADGASSPEMKRPSAPGVGSGMFESRSAKAIVLASGRTLTALVGLASAAVLARLFTKEDYAAYRQTLLVYLLLAPFFSMGLPQALYYFLPMERKRPLGVLLENLLLLTVGGAAMSLLILCGRAWLAQRFDNPSLANSLLILAPYPLVGLPASAFGACLLARGRAGTVAVFNVVSRVIVLLAVLVPALLWPVLLVAVAGFVTGSLLTGAVALLLMFHVCACGPWRPASAGLRSQVAFGVPLGLAGLAGIVDRNLDKVMVAALCAPGAFAVYVNGAMEIPLIGVITGAVASVLVVEYRKLHAERRTDEIVRLIHRAMMKCGLIIIPTMFFLLCTAPEVMRILYGPAYAASAAPFRIYLLLLPIRTLTFGAVLTATGNTRHVMIQSVLTLVINAVLTWIAIHAFGPLGAAAATVASVYLVAIPCLVLVFRRILHCPVRRLFPWTGLLRLLGAAMAGAIGALAVKALLADWPDVIVLALSGVTFAAVASCALVRFGVIRLSSVVSWPRRVLQGRT